jgi:ribonuclease BN (tRNA processing enzyme)
MKRLISILTVVVLALFAAVPAHAETRFVILGTQGGPIPAPTRSQPANLLIVDGMKTLVDVGDGTAGQLSKLRLPTAQIDNVLISHLHFDHMGGLQAMLGLRFQTNAPKPLQVYGPPGTDILVRGLVASMAPAMEANYGVPGQPSMTAEQLVKATVIKAGDTFNLGNTKVIVAKNTHYSFPPDSLKDKKFQSLSFRFETPDKTIVYTSDTGPSTEVEKLSKGADIFISEMIDLQLTIDVIKKISPHIPAKQLEGMKFHLGRHHLTPSELGKMAASAGVKALVVTHLVPGAAMTEKHLKAYEKEIAAEFSGKITIANDMDTF